MKKIFTLLAFLLGSSHVATQAENSESYVPLVREGVEWVNTQVIACGLPVEENWHFTLELKGDTLVKGKNYKKCHYYKGENPDKSQDSIVALLREDNKVVYCLNNHMLEDRGQSYFSPDKEYILYDFISPENAIGGEILNREEGRYPTASTEVINGTTRKKWIFGSDPFRAIIEGIGYVAYRHSEPGSLLAPFMSEISGLGGCYSWLFYVRENGKEVYRNPNTNTAVNSIEQDPIAQDTNFYNLQGIKVDESNLQPGIYIHNHKKIIIK